MPQQQQLLWIVNNLTENLFSAPAFTYSSIAYTNTRFIYFIKKTITFVPFDSNSYKTYVRNSDIYPPVDYTSHTTIRKEQGYKITADGNFG